MEVLTNDNTFGNDSMTPELINERDIKKDLQQPIGGWFFGLGSKRRLNEARRLR